MKILIASMFFDFFSTKLPIGKEHSGVDFSYTGAMYTVPDSGNKSVVWKFYGKEIAEPIYMNFSNRDWEDISIAGCRSFQSLECLYIGDFGTNTTGSRMPVVYEVDLSNPRRHVKHVLEYGDYEADTEALIVKGGVIYTIKKDGYRNLYKEDRGVLKKCGRLDDSGVYVTGADWQDNRLAIVYHTRGGEYRAKEYVMDGCKVIDSRQLNFSSRRQVEGIAYGEKSIVAVSEDGSVFNID